MESSNPVTGRAKAVDRVKAGLGDAFDESHAGVHAFFAAHLPTGQPAEFLPELLGVDAAAFQIAEEALLLERVEVAFHVGETDFFKAPDGLWEIQFDDNSTEIKCNGFYHIGPHKKTPVFQVFFFFFDVALSRFELLTSCLSSRRSKPAELKDLSNWGSAPNPAAPTCYYARPSLTVSASG